MALLLIVVFLLKYSYIILPIVVIAFILKKRSARKAQINRHNDFIAHATSEKKLLNEHNQFNDDPTHKNASTKHW